jgi:hypothetical protein
LTPAITHCPRTQAGDDDDFGLGGASAAHGHQDTLVASAILAWQREEKESTRELTILRTDRFSQKAIGMQYKNRKIFTLVCVLMIFSILPLWFAHELEKGSSHSMGWFWH